MTGIAAPRTAMTSTPIVLMSIVSSPIVSNS